MRIVNYKKFIMSMTLLMVLFLIFLLTLCNTVLSYGTPVYSTIYVEYGDTLWHISEVQANTNLYYEGKDIRYVIKDINENVHGIGKWQWNSSLGQYCHVLLCLGHTLIQGKRFSSTQAHTFSTKLNYKILCYL